MARRLGLPFWAVLGEGSYVSQIAAPVAEVAALVAALVACKDSTTRPSEA
jgi:hypothetical protein